MKLDPSLLESYNWKNIETKIYQEWLDSGYFNPDNLKLNDTAETFTCILPPPNVTGTLHIGHTLMLAIQDTIIRYKRMQGFKTLWLPGTDHAAIATQSVVEKKILKEENKNKSELGREEMLKRIEDFVINSKNTIISQFQSMGASLDWSRLAFTLDEKRNLAVRTMFKKMYDDKLIYRGQKIINWDIKGQTSISDDEIVMEEREATLYTFKYSAECPIAISSTRPETKIGDTAIAIHPNDQRYQKYLGQTWEYIFAGCKIQVKIVADKNVDPEFGTGALGVTPCHSPIDWEIAETHNLEKKQIINEYGKIYNVENPELVNLNVNQAREYIVNWLKENNLILKEEKIKHNIPTAERTGGLIESLPKLQWFIAVNKKFNHFGQERTLKELMLQAIQDKNIFQTNSEKEKVEINPERFEKVYIHWIENLKDWCISRQIWYGHRINVWYKKDTNQNEIYCDVNPPQDLENWTQDEDTLDTWFSSGMWTFSTLNWPDLNSKDLKNFHPTDFLETGYDIIFFWVARMILMTTYALNQIPFRKVYLHGLVRDAQGRKMSKSLGNILDPREISEKYGTDALRIGLIVGNGMGNDLKLNPEKIKAYRNFANKIWNAARFVIEKTENQNHTKNKLNANLNNLNTDLLNAEDEKILQNWRKKLQEITEDLDNYKLHLASEKLYDFFWHEFCDKILENKKIILQDTEEKSETETEFEIIKEKNKNKISAKILLQILLREQIITLHPFMPFITEEIWKFIKNTDDNLLLVTNWVKK